MQVETALRCTSDKYKATLEGVESPKGSKFLNTTDSGLFERLRKAAKESKQVELFLKQAKVIIKEIEDRYNYYSNMVSYLRQEDRAKQKVIDELKLQVKLVEGYSELLRTENGNLKKSGAKEKVNAIDAINQIRNLTSESTNESQFSADYFPEKMQIREEHLISTLPTSYRYTLQLEVNLEDAYGHFWVQINRHSDKKVHAIRCQKSSPWSHELGALVDHLGDSIHSWVINVQKPTEEAKRLARILLLKEGIDFAVMGISREDLV